MAELAVLAMLGVRIVVFRGEGIMRIINIMAGVRINGKSGDGVERYDVDDIAFGFVDAWKGLDDGPAESLPERVRQVVELVL
jgi:hypothetical protein